MPLHGRQAANWLAIAAQKAASSTRKAVRFVTYDGVKAGEGSADGETAEAGLGNGRVDDALVAEAVQETLCDLVGAVVLGNLLTQDEDLGVLLELLGEGLVEGLTDRVLLDAGAVGVGSRGVVGAKVDGASGHGASDRGSGELGRQASLGGGRDAGGRAEDSRHC